MARLLNCPDCGTQFYDTLEACPNCGRPTKTCELSSDLIDCPCCGASISSEAKRCPQCGKKITAPLDFGNAIYDCLFRKTLQFDGRSRRSEVFPYIIAIHFLMPLIFVPAVAIRSKVMSILLNNETLARIFINNETLDKTFFIIAILLGIFFTVVVLAALVRRLHDVGRSGWWLLCPIIPLYWLLRDSDRHANEYGLSQKYQPEFVGGQLKDYSKRMALFAIILFPIVIILQIYYGLSLLPLSLFSIF